LHQLSPPKSKEISMHKILLSALAATTLLSAGLLASRAAATTTLIREAAVVCGGGNGCNVVQTKGAKQRKIQWLGHG
jgi:5-enolpyruvylshikimate-3-phosphate synthase